MDLESEGIKKWGRGGKMSPSRVQNAIHTRLRRCEKQMWTDNNY